MTNLSSPRRPKLLAGGFARQLALAVALASGTAVLAVPGFTDAAYAQKKKKKDEAADAAKPVYSKEFVEAYKALEAQIKAWHRADEISRQLERIPGIGPLTASALVASIGDAKNLKNGRQLAAWLGLVPRQHSSVESRRC